MLRQNDLFLELLTNYMIINLNVFGSLMKYGIFQQCVLLSCCHHIVSWDTQGKTNLSRNLYARLTLMSHLPSPCIPIALDWETILCFLLFYDTKFPPKRTQYPVVNLLSKGHHAQSAGCECEALGLAQTHNRRLGSCRTQACLVMARGRGSSSAWARRDWWWD